MISEVITSVHGIPTRKSQNGDEVGQIWLKNCTDSWFKLSERVISVSEKAPDIENITWAQTDSRPSMSAIINAMNPQNGSHSLFCNGDILITNQFLQSLGEINPNALYIARRVDVALSKTSKNECSIEGVYQYGLDAFVFPKNLIDLIKEKSIFPEDFKIGQPWWDYAIPVLAIYVGIPTYLIDNKPPTVLHHIHPTLNWSEESWLALGSVFIKFCEDLQKTASNHSAQFISEILRSYHKAKGSQTDKLNVVSKKFKSLISRLPAPPNQDGLFTKWAKAIYRPSKLILDKPA